ncbi:MAG: hypothetical protein ACI4NE_03280 [Succinivibrio sp.]
MDVASSTISNVVSLGVSHAAQEARRDSIARETIPQINQNAATSTNVMVSQGQTQISPAQTSLFIQADTLIKNFNEKSSVSRKETKTVKKESEVKEAKETEASSSASSSASGSSLEKEVTAAGGTNAALGGSFGVTGVAFSADADKRRQKKQGGYTAKAVADAYSKITPNFNKGIHIDIRG